METFSRWKVRIKRKLRVSRTARILAPREIDETVNCVPVMILRNRVEEEEIVRDPILKTTEKKNGACARFRAVPWSTKETGRGGRRGKKARNRLTMKLQCNDLTAVFHLARLYVAFCPSNHGWILLPFPCKFISSRDSVREYSYVPYTNFYPEITSWKDWKDFYTIR